MNSGEVLPRRTRSNMRNLLSYLWFRHSMTVSASGIESAGVTERSPEFTDRSSGIGNTGSGRTLASAPAAGANHHNTHGRGCSMFERTRKPEQGACSVPAEVTAAMVELNETLTVLSELVGPSNCGLVADAIRAAAVVTDAVQDMAADMAVAA